ncbi:MAG: aminotransferase class III-fold pyridoxal phosphate-dependent enzyme, partial [Chitinophagaceae bacterium]
NGYHGNTSLGIEISSYKFDGKGGNGAGSSILKLPLPNLYRGIFNTSKEYANDAKEKIAKYIEKNNSPAAFIAEPISGCGGQVPLANGYLKELNAYNSSNQLITIIDETQTGFGRLGKWYWGFEMHDIIPDIVILGKPMGNGHPMAAVITTDAIANSFNNGMEFFSSFGGNPVSCEVGSAVLSIIEEEQLQANALLVGNYFKKRLNDLKNFFPCIGDVRGEGLFLGIEFTNTDGNPDTALAEFVKDELKSNFILSGTDGPSNNVIKIKPPMCFTTNNADEFINKFQKILQTKLPDK